MPDTFTPRFLGRAMLAGLLGFAATGAIAADGSVAGSSPGEITRSAEVRVSDLDLASAQGLALLASRIDFAARQACDMHRGSAIDKLPSAQACLVQARAGALAQIEARGVAVPRQLATNLAS